MYLRLNDVPLPPIYGRGPIRGAPRAVEHRPLLVLTPDRVERELRAAEEADYWATEERRGWYRRIGVAARLWWAGAWLLGWSVNTDSYAIGQAAFWAGVLLGNLAFYTLLAYLCAAEPA